MENKPHQAKAEVSPEKEKEKWQFITLWTPNAKEIGETLWNQSIKGKIKYDEFAVFEKNPYEKIEEQEKECVCGQGGDHQCGAGTPEKEKERDDNPFALAHGNPNYKNANTIPPPPELPESWEEEFDKKFVSDGLVHDVNGPIEAKTIKSFIAAHIKKEKEAERSRLRKIIQETKTNARSGEEISFCRGGQAMKEYILSLLEE